MKPEISLPRLQASSICHYPEPEQSSPLLPDPFLEKSLGNEGNTFYYYSTKYHWLRSEWKSSKCNNVIKPKLTNWVTTQISINPLTPNELWKLRAVSPLKIRIPSKKSRKEALREGI
jgi:hypothetical protein